MRLVLAVERYFPAIGGAERVVQRVAEGLAGRGHDVTVITSGPRSSERVSGVAVERFPVRGNEALGIRGDVDAALRHVESIQPELVFAYAAQTWTADACSIFLDKPRTFRMVLAPCGFSALGAQRYGRYFNSLRERLPRYDALVFHSAIYQDWDFAVDAGAVRRFVIPNGADEALPRVPTTGKPLTITIGSHVRTKGHADFARLVRELGDYCRGAIVAPARTGREAIRGCQPACALRAAASGGDLELVDGRDPSVAPRMLARADLFVLPSRVECAPLVILEAMAAGVPWVSYDVGNVRELAGGVVVNSFARLVGAASDLLERNDRTLVDAGRRAWAANHRWTDVVAKYERLFTDLVSNGRAAHAR